MGSVGGRQTEGSEAGKENGSVVGFYTASYLIYHVVWLTVALGAL